MQWTSIRHLVATDEGGIVAAAFVDKVVQIWSWKNGEQIGEFDSVLDFGGRRITITPDGTTCITASWRHGISAHAVPSGKTLWHRTDIRHIQRVTVNATGMKIYCGLESNSVLELEIETGHQIDKRGGVRTIISGSFAHELIVMKDRYLVRGSDDCEIRAASFSLHDAAFSEDKICISEPQVGNRCIDFKTGDTVWHHKSFGFNDACFDTFDSNFYCITSFHTNPPEKFLVRLAASLENCIAMVALGRRSLAEAFTPSGRVFVASTGEVYETHTGTQIASLPFPIQPGA